MLKNAMDPEWNIQDTALGFMLEEPVGGLCYIKSSKKKLFLQDSFIHAKLKPALYWEFVFHELLLTELQLRLSRKKCILYGSN